jgi:hypothetical protein
MSTLAVNEETGHLTQTWDADGYSETGQGTFKNGFRSLKSVTDEVAGGVGIVNDRSLDRRTGIVSTAIKGKFELEPNREVCRLHE